MNLASIQKSIQDFNGDGWLFCDIENRDKVSYKILDLDEKALTTRRWFYFIPRHGEPVKIVHGIERHRLDSLPGKVLAYVGWKELHNVLRRTLAGCKRIFMQYSPLNNLPLISHVDAGTVELIRSFDVYVISSADLIQLFEARLDQEHMRLHEEAGYKVQAIKDHAFKFIGKAVRGNRAVTEFDVQVYILEKFEKQGLTCDGLYPIVAINEHAADPHFEPTATNSHVISHGDRVLIDLWAKLNVPKGIYYDITWCGYIGNAPPADYQLFFNIAVEARNRAKAFIAEKFTRSELLYGWQVDDVVRDYMKQKGVAEYFIHRTGHSIHTAVHGNGANLDNLETKDDRQLIPGTCFSIEPGIYKDGIGVRSEINVLIDEKGNIRVIGEEQQHLILL